MNCFAKNTERNELYTRTARELGFEPAWDENLQYSKKQDNDDVRRWYAIQERVVEHCLSTVDTSMLRYMGTAATTRDLVAMADAFDGPGRPISFWGMGYGSLIGSHLLKSACSPSTRPVPDD